jgi:RNA polymerase sigma-70 factor (ECF subfamily)
MAGRPTFIQTMMTAPSLPADPEGRPDGPPLLAPCQAGDEGAWRRLITGRAAQVYRWAVWMGLDRTDAEDAAQEVFVVAARRIGRCHAEAALTSWLFQITRRVCANRRRQARWRRWLGRPADDQSPAFEPPPGLGIGDELAVRACLRRLSPRLAEALIAVELEGLTREEAAIALGVPAGTVASRVRLARRAFQALWDADTEEIP